MSLLRKRRKIEDRGGNAKVGLTYVTNISFESLFILNCPGNLNMDLFQGNRKIVIFIY